MLQFFGVVIIGIDLLLLSGNGLGFVPSDAAADTQGSRCWFIFTHHVAVTYIYINLN